MLRGPRDEGARAGFDGVEVALGCERRVGERRSQPAGDRAGLEECDDVVEVRAAGRQHGDRGQGIADHPDVRRATRDAHGIHFHHVRAGVVRCDDLARGVGAGAEQYAVCLRHGRDFEREIGRDQEPRAGGDRGLGLRRGEHGAGAEYGIEVLGGESAQYAGCVGHRVGDFDEADAATGDRARGFVRGVVTGRADHGHEPVATQSDELRMFEGCHVEAEGTRRHSGASSAVA